MAQVERQILWVNSLAMILLLFLLWSLGRPFVALMMQRFEQTAFEQVVRQLNAACQARLIEAKAGVGADIRGWLDANPVACLPEEGMSGWDYRGEDIAIEQQTRGTWVFDLEEAELSYRWRHTKRLINQDPEPDITRFKLTAEFADSNDNQLLDDNEAINGLYLQQRFEYQWQ